MKLYDSPADVVRKAIIGRGISPAVVAAEAGLSSRDLAGFLNGQFSSTAATGLAKPLGLDAQALGKLPDYEPDTRLPQGVIRVSVPFEDDEVNLWFIESGNTRLIIDSGFRSNDLLHSLGSHPAIANHLLITHAHRDHTGGIASAMSELRSAHSPSGLAGTKTIAVGDALVIGPFAIRTLDLAGHHPETLGYHIEGPDLRLLAVGDAIFAGSMGGCANPAAFDRARKTITDALADTKDELILLPGHGPATSVGSELTANPFLAAWMPR